MEAPLNLHSDTDDLVTIGQLLNIQLYDLAYPLFEALLERNPEDASYHLAAGKCAHVIGRIQRAFDHFTIAHELRPNAQSAKHMAELLFITGQPEEALAFSYFAFENDPTSNSNGELKVLHAECLEALGYSALAKEMLEAPSSGIHYGFLLIKPWQERKDACLARVQNIESKPIIETDISLSFD